MTCEWDPGEEADPHHVVRLPAALEDVIACEHPNLESTVEHGPEVTSGAT